MFTIMRVQALLPLLSLLAAPALAAPLHSTRQLGNGLEAILFDAPAAISATGTLASAEAFTFSTPIDTSKLGDVLSPILAPLRLFGIDADDALQRALDRLRLFAAVPEGGQALKIDVNGCKQPAALTATDDNGLAVQNVPIGACDGASFAGVLEGAGTSTNMTVFPSPDSGFGVISGAYLLSRTDAKGRRLTARLQTLTTRRRSATCSTSSSSSRRRSSTIPSPSRACPSSTRTSPSR